MANTTSIGTNAMPQGGVTALQPVEPTAMDPAVQELVDQLTPLQERFREQSNILTKLLGSKNYDSGPGSVAEVKISSVGLALSCTTKHILVITLKNAGAAAEVVSVSKHFPYDLILSTIVSVNGGAAIYTASGPLGLYAYARRVRGLLRPTDSGPNGVGLSPSLCSVSVSGGTVTNSVASSPSFSGIDSISIAAGATCTITATFVTFQPFTLSKDSMIGLLPLQNSDTYANISHTLSTKLVTTNADQTYSFYSAGADVTGAITGSGSSYAQSKYAFCTVPTDPGLYLELVGNSYQVQQQNGLIASEAGALVDLYEIPRNNFLIALHLMGRDTTTAAIPYVNWGTLVLSYNAGVITVAQQEPVITRAEQQDFYDVDLGAFPGYRIWDGMHTTNSPYQQDRMGWVNMYKAADTVLSTTLATGVAVPIQYSVLREQLVAGAVQVV